MDVRSWIKRFITTTPFSGKSHPGRRIGSMIEIRAESQLHFPSTPLPESMQKHPVCYRKNIGGEWVRYSPPGDSMSLQRALLRINNAYRNQMNRTFENQKVVLTVCVLSTLLVCVALAYQTIVIPSTRLISPDDLA